MAMTDHIESLRRGDKPIPPQLTVMLLVKLGRAAQLQVTEALKPIQLTPRHLWALHELRGGATSQQALCDVVGVDPSKLVGLLNDLEAAALVVRRRDPSDRRRHIVELSEKGVARLAAAEQAITAVQEQLLTGLDDQQRADFQNVLLRAAQNVRLDGWSGTELDGHAADCQPPADAQPAR